MKRLLLWWTVLLCTTVDAMVVSGMVELEGLLNIDHIIRDHTADPVNCFYRTYRRTLYRWTHDANVKVLSLPLDTTRGRCVHFAVLLGAAAKRCGLPYRFVIGQRHADLEVALTPRQVLQVHHLQNTRPLYSRRGHERRQYYKVGYFVSGFRHRPGVGTTRNMVAGTVYYADSVTLHKIVSSTRLSRASRNQIRIEMKRASRQLRRWIPRLRRQIYRQHSAMTFVLQTFDWKMRKRFATLAQAELARYHVRFCLVLWIRMWGGRKLRHTSIEDLVQHWCGDLVEVLRHDKILNLS